MNKKYVKKREGIGKNYCYDQSHDSGSKDSEMNEQFLASSNNICFKSWNKYFFLKWTGSQKVQQKWRGKNYKKVYFSLLIKYFPLLEYHVSNSSHISLKLKKKINYVMSIPIQINIGSIFSLINLLTFSWHSGSKITHLHRIFTFGGILWNICCFHHDVLLITEWNTFSWNRQK